MGTLNPVGCISVQHTSPVRSDAAMTQRGAAIGAQGAVFRLESGCWTVAYAGKVCRFKNTKGMGYLAALLARPGEPILAVDLSCSSHGSAYPGPHPSVTAEHARLNVTRALGGVLRRLKKHHPALWSHLRHTVRTGRSCAYTPDERAPLHWDI